ncbi:hypothetical protein WOLCODRAFT_162096 [Wolfiporia cocos MD-104 SS10]|uniref:Uncharacterized protein n=1 Tax=Wolfiporia cocos (strain MD-104) TaxID=742152 RepID=A0A2H3JJR8_WOLCO|nr:hypothetical protein WOLCODRAFT_162096 [Wolfiporia cocos MD-104 SS10]
MLEKPSCSVSPLFRSKQDSPMPVLSAAGHHLFACEMQLGDSRGHTGRTPVAAGPPCRRQQSHPRNDTLLLPRPTNKAARMLKNTIRHRRAWLRIELDRAPDSRCQGQGMMPVVITADILRGVQQGQRGASAEARTARKSLWA